MDSPPFSRGLASSELSPQALLPLDLLKSPPQKALMWATPRENPKPSRYLKISPQPPERDAVYLMLTGVQHVVSRKEALYACFYDTRDALKCSMNLRKTFSQYQVDFPNAQEFQEATDVAMKDIGEFVVLGVPANLDIHDSLRYYGEIKNVNTSKSGALTVEYYDVRASEKAFTNLPDLVRSVHGVQVMVERPKLRKNALDSMSCESLWSENFKPKFEEKRRSKNLSYSTCLRSNSALPKIDLIPKENEFDVQRVIQGKDSRTTIMIRNIPNKYTQQMLIDFINESHRGQYDFLYLRMDFKNRCNVGYAFCNMKNAESLSSFAQRVVGKKWTRFNSDKVCMLSYANIQGRDALIEKFRNSSVMDEHPSYRPKIFSGGSEESFPPPVHRPRFPRSNSPLSDFNQFKDEYFYDFGVEPKQF